MKTFLKNLEVLVDPRNVEDCNSMKSSKGPKKVIVKFSRLKDPNRIRSSKKGLKSMNLSSLGINSMFYINDSLCSCCNMLWG